MLTCAAAAKSLQWCLTLSDPIDGSPPGSPIAGILQARTLEWVAISFSNAWKWKVKVKSLSRVRLLATPWTAAHQAPPSMGFSRQEYWSGVPLPSPHIVYSTLNKHSFKHHLSAQCVLVGMEDPKLSLSFQCLVRKSTSSGSRQNSSNSSPGKTNETKFISIENLRGEM